MPSAVDELGVGLICFPGLQTVAKSLSGLIDVVEIEPQTSWFKSSPESDNFRFDQQFADDLNEMPQPKIFHGVGFPIGGTILPPRTHFDTLNAHIQAVNPVYTSEHLSFNRYCNIEGNISQANFLLPPMQNELGIGTAVRSIIHYRHQTSKPFAFETGTNYLKPRKGEMDDGTFVARIAEESDSYILLDLHNILANERNGRQPLREFIQQLPPERIIEIHLAGGVYYKDYYLDAHAGPSSAELLQLTSDIVRDLPCLKSIVFEMLPDYYKQDETETMLRGQLLAMKKIWDGRNRSARAKRSEIGHHSQISQQSQIGQPSQIEQPSQIGPKTVSPVDNSIVPEIWEYALGSIANGSNDQDIPLQSELLNDPGISIIRDLVQEFRSSMIVSSLKMTCRLIKLYIGSDAFNTLLQTYCATNEAELFGYANALRFSDYLDRLGLPVPYLKDLLDFELSAAQTFLDGQTRTLDLPFDPFSILNDLVKWQFPILDPTSPTRYRVEIRPDDLREGKEEWLKFNAVVHV